ncbi:unnamed protein product [Closterium sp. NIES-54]
MLRQCRNLAALFAIFQISLTSLRQLQSDDFPRQPALPSCCAACSSTSSPPPFPASPLLAILSLKPAIQTSPPIDLQSTHTPCLISADDKLRAEAVSLALRCLSFDFVGTSLDESSEELGTIQVPSSWRAVLEDTATMQLFFDYYAATKPPLSNQALECLVRLASVRRSLFTGEAERLKFLSHLMNGSTEILRSKQGLSQHDNYHEYCRLLGRLKTNYQLAELVNAENYAEWVQLVAQFTITSLQSWQWASGSVYFLLGLWSRLVSSMAYTKSDCPSLLDNFVPQITEAYITSRLDSVQAVLQNNLSEDPLDNDEQLQDQLDNLPYLCRFQFDRTSKFIISHLEPIMQSYTEAARWQPAVAASNTSQAALQVMESQLTWIVHIIGAIVRGRLSSSSGDSQELIDGELAARVFQLIQVTDTGLHAQRYDERSKQRLDLAVLSFFQNFRRVYVGDQAMHASKILYARLADLLGLQDHLMVLNVIVAKIATNLKCYTKSEDVIEQTLNLFQELAGGYMSGKLLLKLDSVNFILANHTSEHFPFLDEPSSTRNRTIFYFTLTRLLFMEDSPQKFKAFVAPLQLVFVKLESMPDASFRTEPVKFALIGLFRDLRGITMATNSRRTFGLLFDWLYLALNRSSPPSSTLHPPSTSLPPALLPPRLTPSSSRRTFGLLFDCLYPAHMPLILRTAHFWPDTPAVTTPLLKFFAEFVVNKTQRLTFDSSSCLSLPSPPPCHDPTGSRRTFGLLFDWLYPAHMPLILRTAQFWSDTPAVTTPLLKFFAEFVVNKTQRLTFDSSSPNGILLFREASKLVVTYGKHALAMPTGAHPYTTKYKGVWIALTVLTRGKKVCIFKVTDLPAPTHMHALAMPTGAHPYTAKYKGVWIALTVLTRGKKPWQATMSTLESWSCMETLPCLMLMFPHFPPSLFPPHSLLISALAGNYVNFGVMELYGDTALPDALDVALKLCLSIPLPEIMAFRKVRVSASPPLLSAIPQICFFTFRPYRVCLLRAVKSDLSLFPPPYHRARLGIFRLSGGPVPQPC